MRPEYAPDPAAALGDALAERLTPEERRRGAHYTPPALADRVVAAALADGTAVACDPACGAGAVLLAAARRLVELGARPVDVARDQVWGADLEPAAAAVSEAALAMWSGGTAPRPGHVVAADALRDGATVWPGAAPFDSVVGNPPFQGQLLRSTARSAEASERLRARFGVAAAGPYVDTAALFLLAAVDLAAPGGRIALLQPRSTVAGRDSGPVRHALAARARLREISLAPPDAFDAAVDACLVVLEVGRRGTSNWSAVLADAEGVPGTELASAGVVGDLASVSAGFRDEYYGLVPHVHESPDRGDPVAPLVTSGLIDVGRCAWGSRPARFARRRWERPVVDLAALEAAGGRAWAHAARVRHPKVVLANQSHVLEAVADHRGHVVPCTPVISVVPADRARVASLAAALCAPPVAAWTARRAAGTGMARGAIRVTARLVEEMPLPAEAAAWAAGTEAFDRWSDGEASLDEWAVEMTRAYGVTGRSAEAVLSWWRARLPSRT